MPKEEEVKEITMEDIFEKLFYETEEQRQDRLQEEYQINSGEDIDKLLASNLSYRDKMILLRKERQRVDSLGYAMDEAEYKFRNTRYFLNKMKEACREIKNDMKFDIPVSISGICISSATYYQLCNFLEKNRFTDLSIDQYGGFLLGGIFAPLVGLIYAYNSVKDVAEYKNYQKQIKSYTRRLRNEKRQ